MSLPIIGITVLWLFLYAYILIASIDFGAGFYVYYAKWRKKDSKMSMLINRYLSPIWEVANVFLVCFYVGMIGFFPDVAYYYGTALLFPGSIALILLTLRSSFYIFGNGKFKKNRFYMLLYVLTGLLIPPVLTTALTTSEGGYLDKQGNTVMFLADKLATSFLSWGFAFLAVVSVLYISASFLTYYASRAGEEESVDVLRKFALFWSVPSIVASVIVFWSMRTHNFDHFQHMIEPSIVWTFALSFVCFLGATHFLYHRSRFGLAFIFVMFQYFFAFFGYGAGHLPYILYPYITIHSGVTNELMSKALVIAFVLGLLLFITSIVLVLRLFLFDAKHVKNMK
ncbi:cytochrome d ubiquinol oxidase subunit II [Ectobacillus sp. sgz5001026]|uniref:cytochrome d ubiquinol oxidase subunit II n=1 Tax=Ectobacillus sp. sgz5001026 TaxID=3242473 RepID=UPI0036D3203A